MPGHALVGLGITLAAVVGYVASWHFSRRRRHLLALILLFACGLLLRFMAAGDAFIHPWDERYHALVAKNLRLDPLRPLLYADPLLPYDYRDWGANSVWVHKPPLPLWAMALSLRLFGVNELALRLPSLLLSAAGILMIARLARLLFGRSVAWFAAFLYSFHGLTIELVAGRTATDHIDVFFQVAVLAAIWCAAEFAARGRAIWNLFAALALGAAVLSKWLPGLVVLPVWLGLALAARRFSRRELIAQAAVLIGVSTALWLPWQLYIYARFPLEAAQEASFNFRHISQALDGHDHGLFWHFTILPRLYGELIALPLGWFVWRALRGRRDGKRLALLAWFLLPYLFFSIARTKMQAYTSFSAPAVILIAALAMELLRRRRRRFRLRWLPTLLLAGLIALPVRYGLERLKPIRAFAPAPTWVEEIKALRPQAVGAKLAVFGASHPIETMFYLDCVAYPVLPDTALVVALEGRGYRVVRLGPAAGAED